jgi:protein arginine kinase
MGDFYQISNQITLGKSEQQLIDGLGDVIPRIIRYERKVRDELVRKNRSELHDQISRAYGILQTAQTISSEETMQRLSSVRMGINLELIDDLGIPAVNELLIHTQPAHLQKLNNSQLEVRERNEARATFLRRRLAERRGEQN